MVNFFEHLRDNLHFNKFILENLLCVEYSCPLKEVEMGIWAQTDQVIHVLSGKKSWRTLQGTFEVKEGDTVYIKKGAAFIKQFFDDDFCMLAFFVTDDLIREALKDLKAYESDDFNPDTDFHVLYVKDTNLLDSYFQGVLHHFQTKVKPLDTLLELKFKELIINIIMGNQNPQLTRYFLDIAKNTLPPLSYIMEQNYCYNLSLSEFAKLCNRSLSSFKRDFQDHYQTTPGKWLTSKRLEHAALLLKDDTLNVAEVAYECGFKDNSHFGRSFKGRFGKTPLDFRNSLKLA
jgi:AraC-like DNA-binding protein